MKISLLFFILFISCGTNTDTPVVFAPNIFFTSPISVPQFLGIIPTEEIPTSGPGIPDLPISELNPNKPEFIVKYFVINSESQFIGYNLSITAQTPTLIVTQAGVAGSIYTENGIQPSFPHLATENSTAPESLKRRKIGWRVPPPSSLFFQKCEVYTFTLRAVLSNVPQTSNPSVPVRACASTDPSKCTVGSSCNSTTCSNSACRQDSERPNCIVGTLCNPCTILDSAGKPKAGCECPDTISPRYDYDSANPTVRQSTTIACNR